jgi:hypothetical protein
MGKSLKIPVLLFTLFQLILVHVVTCNLYSTPLYEDVVRGRAAQDTFIFHYLLPQVVASLDTTTIGYFHRIAAGDTLLLASTGSILYKSTDHGDSWTEVHHFGNEWISSIYLKDNNTVFIGTSIRNQPGKLYRTSDLVDFVPVLATSNDNEFFSEMGIGWSGSVIYAGEYNQFSDTTQYVDIFVWKSTDNGSTWNRVLNLTNVIGHKLRHVHLVAVDPYTKDVYITTGDNPNNGTIVFSQDGGTTWKKIVAAPWRIYHPHIEPNFEFDAPVSVIFLEDYIYFGSDVPGHGIVWRYKRTQEEFGNLQPLVYIPNSLLDNTGFFGMTIKDSVIYFTSSGLDTTPSSVWVSDAKLKRIIKLFDLPAAWYTNLSQDEYYVYVAGWFGPMIRFRLLDPLAVQNLLYPPAERIASDTLILKGIALNKEAIWYSLMQNPLMNGAKLIISPMQVTNLVLNLSFENGTNHWYLNQCNLTTEDAYDGFYSAKLVYPPFCYIGTEPISIVSSCRYRLSFYYKYRSSNITHIHPGIRALWLDSGMNEIGTEPVKFEPGYDPWFTKDWKRAISKTIISPSNAAYVGFNIDLSDYAQTLFLDAFQFQKEPGWASSFLNHNTPTKPSDITLIVECRNYQDSLHVRGTLEKPCTLNITHSLNGILKVRTRIGGSGIIQYCLQRNVMGIEDKDFYILRNSFKVHQYPNPFTRQTEISFQTLVSCYISLRIYDATGRLIKTLIDKSMKEGKHKTIWRPEVASGIYFLRLRTGAFATTRRITLLR